MAAESKADDPVGPSAAFVKLISAEKHVFYVEKRVAMISGTLRSMLSNSSFAEAKGEIEFPEVSTAVLEKVIEYFHYKAKYNNSKVPIPEFPIAPEQALELIMAANYFDC